MDKILADMPIVIERTKIRIKKLPIERRGDY
jgi:hypothetical protein